MTIRPRRADDLLECVEVLTEVHQQDGYPTCWPTNPVDWLELPGALGAWVAEEGGVIAGHIGLEPCIDDGQLIAAAAGRPAAELAMVSRLFVRPGARGRRVGEELVGLATQFGASRGLGLVLEVVNELGSAAMALYERLGWQIVLHYPAGWTTPSGDRPQLCLYQLVTTSA